MKASYEIFTINGQKEINASGKYIAKLEFLIKLN